MVASLELSIVVWLQYSTFKTTLKNLGKLRQKGSPFSHLTPNILQKF